MCFYLSALLTARNIPLSACSFRTFKNRQDVLKSSEVLKQYDFMNLRAVLIIAHPIYSSIMPYLYKESKYVLYSLFVCYVPSQPRR